MMFSVAPVLSAAPAPQAALSTSAEGPVHSPALGAASDTVPSPTAFAFVSNFEDMGLDGWSSTSGTAPSVTSAVNYGGEPSLVSTASGGLQTDSASEGFKTGAPFVSFQVAIDAKGSGFFGLGNDGNALALVGVSMGDVVAGPDTSHLTNLGPVPGGTAYPSGWVYITANVYPGSAKNWFMSVFIDRTDKWAAILHVNGAGAYDEAIIETLSGTVYYSDVVVSTYEIPIYYPGYNNMEGYGQGSGLVVSLLPAYYNLTSQMTLSSWSVPQSGILSFQINAMNSTGTARSTCRGFFQLGIDLDQNGNIAPWYVKGKNCEAVYFTAKPVTTPPGTHLTLSIVFEQVSHQITFTINDTTTSELFTASIPYHGGPFYGMYTQLEWQPCCSTHPIGTYDFDGSLYGIQITTLSDTKQTLGSGYMLPFVLDAPPSWNFGYYQNSLVGYQQRA